MDRLPVLASRAGESSSRTALVTIGCGVRALRSFDPASKANLNRLSSSRRLSGMLRSIFRSGRASSQSDVTMDPARLGKLGLAQRETNRSAPVLQAVGPLLISLLTSRTIRSSETYFGEQTMNEASTISSFSVLLLSGSSSSLNSPRRKALFAMPGILNYALLARAGLALWHRCHG